MNAYTAPLIQKNKVRKVHIIVLNALGIAYSQDKIEEAFSENVTKKELKEIEFYVAGATGDTAFEIHGSGLWGPIHGIIALEPNLETIKGITLIHQEETPGLGGRIADAEFLDKFKAKTILPKLIIQPPGKASKDNEVDGITGATLRSRPPRSTWTRSARPSRKIST